MGLSKENFQTFMKRRYLLYELVKKGIKLKYRRSYLGIMWTLLEPLLQTAVLTLVFGTILGRGGRDYPLYILCGRLLYSMFSSGTKVSSKSIAANAQMIKKVYVPKYMYPLSTVIYNYIIFLISLIIMIPLSIYCRVSLTWHIIEAIIPLIILFVMTFGVGMILATFTVFVRDLEYIWDVVLMLIMYCSAIFYYPEKILTGANAWILKFNPLFDVIQLFRNAVFGVPLDLHMVAFAGGFSIVALVIGVLLFYRKQDEFILYI